MPAQTVIKLRRDTSANWTSVDPILASGELGIETDTNRIKIGDGATEWTGLNYGPVSDNLHIRVKNASGSVAIPAGTIVQFAGAAGDTVTASPAVTDGSVDFHYIIGVTAAEIAADGFGDVVLTGVVGGIDTSAYTVGDFLYADPVNAGQFVTTQPAAPNFREPIAAVTRAGAGTSGLMLVRVNLGDSIESLHDVDLTSITSGQILQFDGTKWVNADIEALPDQTGQAGKYLTTDGTDASWDVVSYNDLTDVPSSFTPSAHATTHELGGSDELTLAQSQVTGLVSDLADKQDDVITTQGDLVTGDASGDPVRLGIGSADQVLTSNGTTAVWADAAGGAGGGGSVLDKADYFSVIFTKTGNGAAEIKAGTSTTVNGATVAFATDTAITMPSLTAGTDYFVYAKDDATAEAVAATGTWPTPVAAPPANSRLIGGFHYAPGGNATAQSGGDTTPQINEYSFWDLKFRPSATDPRGMTLVSGAFWVDIYLLNTDPQTNGTSKYNVTIADGNDPCIVPDAFGGNGATTYSGQTWWNTSEALSAFGKRCISVREASVAFYGTTEESSAGSDPVSTILRAAYTSRWGVMLSTGNMRQWGNEFGGGAGPSSLEAITGGRGSVYLQANAVNLGGVWYVGSDSGSRGALWFDSPSVSASDLGGRGACDHLLLV